MSASSSSPIPLIDISSIVQFGHPSQTLIAEWDAALRSVGFATIVGHGVEAAIVNELYGKAKQFFGLSAQEKLKYWKGEFYGIGGYTPRGVEAANRTIEDEDKHAAVSGMHGQDHLESFIYRLNMADRNEWLPPELQSPVDAYCQAMANLLASIHQLSAHALGLPVDFFDQHYKEPLNALKLSNYLPLAQRDNGERSADDADDDALLYGIHKDILVPISVYSGKMIFDLTFQFHGFTILRQDGSVGCLEFWLDGPKQWVPVPHDIQNSFVVNAGNIIEHWTNGIWKSSLHRVTYPPMAQQAHFSRLSMIFFTGPSPETQVAPLPSCVEITGGKPLYTPLTAQEYLMMKVKAANWT